VANNSKEQPILLPLNIFREGGERSGTRYRKNIGNICETALKKLGFIESVIGRYSGKKVKETCHFAVVGPHLEYAASVWDRGH
jgi:hypothetical protein